MDEKQAPLHKRVMDVGHTIAENAKANSAALKQRHFESKYVEVPIVIDFNWDSLPVGYVRITKEAAALLKAGIVLSPAYEIESGKLVGMGLIPAANAVEKSGVVKPTKEKEANGHYDGFGWHLFVIAIVAGILAIIALLIRLFYIRGL